MLEFCALALCSRNTGDLAVLTATQPRRPAFGGTHFFSRSSYLSRIPVPRSARYTLTLFEIHCAADFLRSRVFGGVLDPCRIFIVSRRAVCSPRFPLFI